MGVIVYFRFMLLFLVVGLGLFRGWEELLLWRNSALQLSHCLLTCTYRDISRSHRVLGAVVMHSISPVDRRELVREQGR